MSYYVQRDELIDVAEAAYKRARRLVYDACPPGVPLDRVKLTIRQQCALTALETAEAKLAELHTNRTLAHA